MGFTKTHFFLFSLVTIVMLLGVKYYFDNGITNDHVPDATVIEINKNKYSENQKLKFHTSYLERTIINLVQQRNNMSRAMNLKQQKIGQMECKEATRNKVRQKVSSTGGWCAQTSVENSGEHKTDTKLVPVLAKFFQDKYVASFGDGPGRYKQLLSDSGLLKGYDAYDGAPFSEKTSEGRVMYLDLTLPQYGLPLYDWVMSLEVAEHIPKEYESIYLDNIARHAKEGIILSWAKPGQGGFSHVNTRPFEYVKAAFEKLGFEHDAQNSDMLKKAASLEWLQWNTNVYRRKDLSNIDHIKTLLT
ncbi:uncharacterized protein LOC132748972 isoform X3 [Ruditapes philippinarum]|uniref:uncharacterized protein LOC132748972 isoform X3 n=1 Tax=Ruditapes philippinarum TaxID=129788 RepID=UPI00295BED3E|nr:uncharacterized protein LOC132748972 isoform X3 [Ruditapes philippinarum]